MVLTSPLYSYNEEESSIEKDLIKINSFLDSCWVYRTENPYLALEYGQKALKIIDEKNIISIRPKTLNYLGVVYRKLGDLEKSYDYFQSALYVAKEIKDSIQIGYTYNNLTDYYLRKASYTIALENVLIGFKIFDKLNHKVGKAYSLNYLGEIYIHHGDLKKALSYLENAMQLRLELNDLRGYSNTLMNIGIIYFKQNNFKKAIQTYEKANIINEKINYSKGISNVLSLISDINYENKDYKKALNNINKSLEIDEKIENRAGIITSYNKLGLIYLKLHKYDSAKEAFDLALSLAFESGHLDQEMLSYLYLSDYYSALNQNKNALEFFKKYNTIKDSIYSQGNMGRFADLQTLFATNRSEIENKLLKNEIDFEKRTNNYLILISFIVFILILLLVSKYKAQNKTNSLLKELNSSKDKFFSILAHDLKNPFQALMGYTDMLHDDFDEFSMDEIKSSINSLKNISHNVYNLLEGLLDWSRAQTGRMEYNPTIFKLSEESKSVVELYKQTAISKNINLSTEIDDSINIYADRNMIKTIIRNLVANGLKFTNENGSVKILAEKSKTEIKVIVEDIGIGMSQEIVANLFRIDIHHTTLGTEGEVGTGVGLMLCYELIKHNKGKIWAESELGKGSKFIFTLPVLK